MNRYFQHFERNVSRNLQSKYLGLRSMNIPSLDNIYLSIEVADSSKFLPAYFSLEMLSGQKPQPMLDPRFGVRGPVTKVQTVLRRSKMYNFYDNLVNIYVPALKRNDLLGDDEGIVNDLDRLLLENILTSKDKLSFTIDNLHYMLPLEREFQIFSNCEAEDLQLKVEIDVKNRLKEKHLE